MTDWDLFADPEPDEAPAPDEPTPPAPAHDLVHLADQPCSWPAHGTHRCRVGGGSGSLSDDGGRTWFCSLHQPLTSPGFFPHQRKPGDR